LHREPERRALCASSIPPSPSSSSLLMILPFYSHYLLLVSLIELKRHRLDWRDKMGNEDWTQMLLLLFLFPCYFFIFFGYNWVRY
jgi:hypothetical protein